MPIDPWVKAVPSIGAKVANSIDPDRTKRRNLLDVATDFLSTGNYAGAGFVSGVLDALDGNDDDGLDLLTKPLEGAVRGVQSGFTGENPVRYGDVLRKMGAPDKVSAIGGLVGDVLLDPLNFVSFFSPTKLGHAAELYAQLKKAGTLDHVLAGGGDLAKLVEKLGGREAADAALAEGHTWVDKFHRGHMALANLERPTFAGGKAPFASLGDLGHLAAATRPGQAVMRSAAGPAFKAVGDALKYVPIGWKTTPFASSEAILPRLQGSFLRSADLFLKSAREDIPGVSHVYQAIGKALVPYFRPKEAQQPYGWNVYSNIVRQFDDTLKARNIAGEEAIRTLLTEPSGNTMDKLADFLVQGGASPHSPEITFLRGHAAVAMSPEDQHAILASLQRPYHTNIAGDTDRRITAIFGGLTPQDVRQYGEVDPQRFATAKAHLAKAIEDTRAAMRLAPLDEQAQLQAHLDELLLRHDVTFGQYHESVDPELYDLLNQKPEEFHGAMQQRIAMLQRQRDELIARRDRLIQWHKDQNRQTLMPAALQEYVKNLNQVKEDIRDFDLALAAHNDLGSRVEELRLSEADRAKARVDRAKQQVAELRTNHLLQGVVAGAIPKYALESQHLVEMMQRHAGTFNHDGAALAAELGARAAQEPLIKRAARLANGDPEEELKLLQQYTNEARQARREARLVSKQQQTQALEQAGVFQAAKDRTLVMVNGEHPELGAVSVARGANGDWEAVRYQVKGKHSGQRHIQRFKDPEEALGHLMDQGYVFDPQGVMTLPEGIELAPHVPPMTRERAHREIVKLAKRRHGGRIGGKQGEVMRRVLDAQAATWAARTGRSVNEYYALRIAGVSPHAPTTSAFFQQAKPAAADLEKLPEAVAAAHNANGGSSLHPTQGDLGGTDHIAVSKNPERGEVIPGKAVTPDQIRAFVQKNRDLLSDGRHFVGTWYDAGSNQTYVDVSLAVPDLRAARQIGERANQKALWDLKRGVEIPLSGTGAANGAPMTEEELAQVLAGAAERQGVRRVVRFGPSGLTELDPANAAIRNGTVPGAEDARRAGGAPPAFNAYTHRTPYEQKVVRSAPSRYSFDVPEHRLYNLGEDQEHLLAAATQAGAKNAQDAVTWAEHELLRRGYAGYVNPNGGLPSGVVMLEKVGPEARLMEHPSNAPWMKDLPESDYYGAKLPEVDEVGQQILDTRGRPVLEDLLESKDPRALSRLSKELGLPDHGPSAPDVQLTWHDPDTGKDHTFGVPGGLGDVEKPFSLHDLFHMDRQAVDIRSMQKHAPEEAARLYQRIGATLTPDKMSDADVFNRYLHSLISPGNNLRLNQVAFSALRAGDIGDVEKMAAAWRERPARMEELMKGGLDEKQAAKAWQDEVWSRYGLHKQETVGKGKKKKWVGGGLGIYGNFSIDNVFKFADDYLRNPKWWRVQPGEDIIHAVNRVQTVLRGAGTKVTSWSLIPQMTRYAQTGALDVHMLGNNWMRGVNKSEVAGYKRAIVEAHNAATGQSVKRYADLSTQQVYDQVTKVVPGIQHQAGVINEAHPLHGTDWGGYEDLIPRTDAGSPLGYHMGETYRRILDDIGKEGAKRGLSISGQQWYEWDAFRGRFEPHAHFLPELDRFPKLSFEQLRRSTERSRLAGITGKAETMYDKMMLAKEAGNNFPTDNSMVLFQGGKKGPRGAVSIAEDGRRWLHLMQTAKADTWAHEAFHLFQDQVDPRLVEQFGHEGLAQQFERYIATGQSPTPELQPVFDDFGALVRRVTDNGHDVPETVRVAFDNLFAEPYVPHTGEQQLDIPHSRQEQIRATWGQSPGRHLNNVEDVLDQHLSDVQAYLGTNASPVTRERLIRHGDEIAADLHAIINTGQAPPYAPQYRARAQQLMERLKRSFSTPLDLLPSETRSIIEPRRLPPRSAPLVPEDRTFTPLPPPERITAETAARNLQKPIELQPLSQAHQLSNDDLLKEGEEHYASYVTMLRRMAQDPATGAVDQAFLQTLLTERFAQSPKLRRATAAEIAGDIIRLSPEQQHRRVAIETLVHHLLETEASRGMLAGVTQNYVPRFRVEHENAGWIMGSRGVKVDRKTFERARGMLKDHPLEAINDYARAIGLKDVYDERLPEVLGLRIKDHNVAITQHDFLKEVVGELGLRIDAKQARSSRFLAHHVMKQLGMDDAAIKEAHALAEQLNAWGVAKDQQNLMIGRGIENLYRTGRLDAPLPFKFHVADRLDPMRLRGVSWDDPRALKARVDQILETTPQDQLVKTVEAFQADIKRTMERYHAITPEVGLYTSRLALAGTNIDDNNFLDALNLFAETPYRPGNHLIPLTPDQMKSARALREESVFVLPKAIADDLNQRITSHFRVHGAPEHQFVQLYDKVMNVWKKLTLYVMPQFHTRNAVTNVINSTWSAGLHDYRWYEEAGKLQLGHEVSFVDRGGREWDRESLLRSMNDHNVLGGGQWDPMEISRRKSPDPMAVGQAVAGAIEGNARAALYLDGLNRGMSEADAALRMKKYLFDYGELTDFERQYLRRWMPFYTWARKNIPLQLEQLVTRPFRYAAPLRAQHGLTQALSGQDLSDRDRAALPAFMRDALPIRHKINPDGTQEVFLMGNWLPLNDLINVTDPGAMAYGMLTPVKGFFEAYVANWNPYFDRPVERYPGETQDFLGIRMGAKERYMLRNLRIANEVDKSLQPGGTVRGRVGQWLFGKSYTVDVEKARQQRLRDFRAQITSLQHALQKEQQKDRKASRTVDIGATDDYFRGRIADVRRQMGEAR